MKQSCHWLLVGGLMMTSLGTFAETQGCLFPPSSETSSIGQVVPWSRSAHRRQSSSWLTHKLLIQLLQTSTHTHTTMGPCQVATGNDYHPMKICEWTESSALAHPPSFISSFPCPHCSLPLSVSSNCPFYHCEKKVCWFKTLSTSCKTFSFLQAEWGNEWMNQPFTVHWNFVGASVVPGLHRTEPFKAEHQHGKESWCFKSAGTTSIWLSPGTFACQHVLQIHLWTIKKCLYWKRSAIFHNAALPSIISILWAVTGRESGLYSSS